MKNEKFDRLIAGVLTAIVTLLLLVLLFVGGVGMDRSQLAASSIPEPTSDEEFFIETEPLVEDAGEPDVAETEETEPAPTEQGEPEPAETDNDKVVVQGENPKPAPQREKPIVQSKPSPVKATEPTKQPDKKESKATSKVASGFSGKNGKPSCVAGGFGTGGKGTTSVRGTSRGRSMLSCPHPSVTLKNKVVITVSVQVTEQGTVTSAKASGAADSRLLRACEQAARQSKWTPKVGAGTVAGSIVFTITPKL